ncbi:MAG: hypothetical protein ABI623_08025 [bacterium]
MNGKIFILVMRKQQGNPWRGMHRQHFKSRLNHNERKNCYSTFTKKTLQRGFN